MTYRCPSCGWTFTVGLTHDRTPPWCGKCGVDFRAESWAVAEAADTDAADEESTDEPAAETFDARTTGEIAGVTAAAVAMVPASAPAVATVDTTASKTLDLCATWSASSASNTITLHTFLVEGLNLNLA